MSLDHLVQRLVTPATRPSPVAIGWHRRAAVVRGVSIEDLLAIAARHPGARDVLWSIVGMSSQPVGKTGPTEAKMLLDLLGTAIGSRSLLTTVRISSLSSAEFDALFRAVIDLTMPAGADAMFGGDDENAPKKPKSMQDEIDESDDARDPAVSLGKLVVHLARHGFHDAVKWTPGRALFTAAVLAEQDSTTARSALVNAAYAVRLGGADAKSWKSNIDKLTEG